MAEWRNNPRVANLRDEAARGCSRIVQRTAQWLGEGRCSLEAAGRLTNWLEP